MGWELKEKHKFKNKCLNHIDMVTNFQNIKAEKEINMIDHLLAFLGAAENGIQMFQTKFYKHKPS